MTGYDSGNVIHASSAVVSVRGCSFLSNTAENFGGAIYVEYSTITIEGSTFDHCITTDSLYGSGGAIFMTSTDFLINGCTFESNSAPFYGGALAATGSTGVIAGCSFVANTADQTGGSVFFETSTATIERSLFQFNIAKV